MRGDEAGGDDQAQADSGEPVLSAWVNREQLALQLGVTCGTLARWGTEGVGPAYIRIGKRVFYRVLTVEEWLVSEERRQGKGLRHG